MKQLHRAAVVAAMLTLPAAAMAQDNSTAGMATTVNTTGATATTTTTGNAMTADPATTGTTGTDTMGTVGMDNTMSDPSMTTMETDTANMTAMDTGFETNEQYTQVQREEDNGVPWGLLGFLGLAGLLGGRKKHASDIHVDARHNNH